jgi:hypothetical protein
MPLHRGLNERSKMKSNSWKKDYIVVMLDDFNNVWIEKTIPCTINQAIKFVIAKRWQHAVEKGVVKIVSHKQLAELQGVAA